MLKSVYLSGICFEICLKFIKIKKFQTMDVVVGYHHNNH